jgi:two-component system sensor histidine kinase KdpD
MGVIVPRKKDEIETSFLSVMTHELSQPLVAALGSTLTLKQRFASRELSNAETDQLFAVAVRNLEQLQALLDSLRVFSEVEAGNLKIETITVSVDDLLKDALGDFGSPSSGTHVVTKTEPGLQVQIDLMMFRQVLSNVINNAAKFSPSGSLVSIDAHREERFVVFTVSDEGGGFPPRDAERIFDRSVRLQPGKKGLGVGLFVARAIVEAHGGVIYAENISGGAKFTFTVPAA